MTRQESRERMVWMAAGAAVFAGGLTFGMLATRGRLTRLFMKGCTHPGVDKGTCCPLCGRIA